MKWKELIEPNTLDRLSSKEMTYPNVYKRKHRGVGGKKGFRYETVVVRDTRTGRVYGRRTIAQKAT